MFRRYKYNITLPPDWIEFHFAGSGYSQGGDNMSSVSNVNEVLNTPQTANTQTQNNQTNSGSGDNNGNTTQVVEDQFIKGPDTAPRHPTYARPGGSVFVSPNMDRVNELQADLKNNVGAFRMMVERMHQAEGNENSFFAAPTTAEELREWVAGVASGRITYDAATIDEARQLISEDGYWGVEAVSDRIVDFARAISGGDLNQYNRLLGAIQKGFGQAQSAWGGKMPDITQQTYDRTMEKMEAWRNDSTSPTQTANALQAVEGAGGV
jgi:hypothetical protein